ncbi:Ig-like domain-containing protein [Candidatus Palauibacter sp.]|uniref:Ig-like domain-containing protein n=1 Tax=Candidatus Palauibacter sp. TaxID=3101350 RepID=UPI003B5B69B7
MPVGSIPAQTLNVGETVRLDVTSYFRDPDGGALTYAAASLAPGVVSVSQLGSVLTMVGVAEGTATVTVTATDPGGLSAAQNVAVTVSTPNRAPEAVGSIPAQSLDAGETVTLEVSGYFRDPDGDALTYTAATSAAGVVSVSISGSSLTVVGVAEGRATVTVTAADPGGLTAVQSAAVTVQQSNRAPEAVGSIRSQSLDAGGRVTLDVSGYFRDPDGDALTYTAATSNAGVVSPSISGSRLTVVGIRPGSASVQVTAADPAGLTATQNVGVTVRGRTGGGFGDGFDDPASLADWEIQNADAAVVNGVLHLTNRMSGSLGVAERASPPMLNQWSVSARVGRATRQASPGVASLTGHKRFSAARLVLRTLDNGGDGDRSADVAGTMVVTDPGGVTADVAGAVSASGGTGTNYELAVFDAERGWLQITNLSGRSDAVDERPNAFTDIELGLDNGDFVAHAKRSETDDGETLFRVSLNATLDNVRLGDILGQMNGLWLVNQGPVNATIHVDDVVATGEATSNRAPEAVGSIPAQSLNPGQSRTIDVSGYFRDPDGDALTYVTSSSNPSVATPTMSRSRVTVTGVAVGSATVTVTASDPSGLSATQTIAVTVQTGDTDREALEAFYNATDGPNWTDNTNWLTDAPLREWYGVSTDASGRVVELGLGGRYDGDRQDWIRHGLSGEIPPELGNLANLQRLYLHVNDLSGSVPTELGGLARLEVLSLYINELTGEIPPELANLSNLETLNVYDNHLTGEIPPELGTLANLELLTVGSNELTGEVPPQLGNLSNLESLGLSYNQLSGRLPDSFLNLDLAEFFWAGNAGLCAPGTSAFRAWLAEIGRHQHGPFCSDNRPPEVVFSLRIENLSVGHGSVHDMAPHFNDPDGDALTFTAVSRDPAVIAASISESVLTVTGVGPGEGVVAVTASDPAGLAATMDVEVTVIEAENRPPEAVGTIPPQTLEPDGETSLDVSSYFRDPDGDALTYTASSSDNAVVAASMWVNDNRLLVLNAGVPGTATVTVTASDPSGLSVDQPIAVTVQTGNRAPEAVGSIPEQSLRLGQNRTVDVASYFRDPDGDALTYSVGSISPAFVARATMSGGRLTVSGVGLGSTTVTVTATDPSGLSAAQDMAVTVTDGAARLTNLASREAVGPRWSPDGAKIAFWSFDASEPERSEIHVMNADGSGLTRLTNRGGGPAWSPDGARIAFTSDAGIYVMNADGSGEARLTDHGVVPQWSPDGAKIMFTSDRDGHSNIYVMNADGSGETRLTTTSSDFQPAWSPDGAKIAFRSGRSGANEIHVMNADGSGVTQLTSRGAGADNPQWSPDGAKIAFISSLGGRRSVFVMNANGSRLTRLTDPSNVDVNAQWSPDGARIAFASERPPVRFGVAYSGIYVMNADGSAETWLTGDGSDRHGNWSPDGAKIAFSSLRDDDDSFQIYVVDIPAADGSASPGADLPGDAPGQSAFEMTPLRR